MLRWKHLRKLLKPSGKAAAKKSKPRHLAPDRTFRSLIASRDIAVAIDVGANRGQFAQQLRQRLGYQGRIISIEPQPDAFAELQRTAATDDNWSVMNLALGDADAVLPLNISINSVSSSILPILDRAVRSAPQAAYAGQVDVPVRRLDSLPELRAAAADRCLLKIDAQGYEHKILQGAEGMIDRLALLYLESSLVPLYEGELLIEEMIAYLRRRNFVPVEISRGHSDGVSGQQLQADILFVRL